jgi:hypothetical protein
LFAQTRPPGAPALLVQRRTVHRSYATAAFETGPLWDVSLTITGAPDETSERVEDFINACMDGIRGAAASLGSGRGAGRRIFTVRMRYRRGFNYAAVDQEAYAAALRSVLPAPSAPTPAPSQPRTQPAPSPTPSAPPLPTPGPSLSYMACFDKNTITVFKNGRTHSCSAFTSSSNPTPNGRFCIRRQGEAQRRGGIAGLFQDRTRWYLLEPQFSTTRSRMMLHHGSRSTGCITVTDANCFQALESILNSAGTVYAAGYDGYPPGNADGVTNPQLPVRCVSWLEVTDPGGCAPGNFPEAPAEDMRG